jgi:hypothetical protein
MTSQHTIISLRIAFATLWFSQPLKAQVKEPDHAYYLNDGGISTSKNIIKLDGLSLIQGNLALLYERVINKTLSIETGGGLRLPYYLPDLSLPFIQTVPGFHPFPGLSFRLETKYYFHRAPELKYLALRFGHSRFPTLALNDYTFHWGKQHIIGKRGIIDASFGLGCRFQKSSNETYYFNPDASFAILFPLHIKFGYLFN